MILVIGATGYLGSEICRLLSVTGKPLRAMVRKPFDEEKTKKLKEFGVQLVQGDLKNRKTFGPALNGVKTIITTASSMPFAYIPNENDPQRVDQEGMINLIDDAFTAGVERFIYTSFTGNINIDFPLCKAKRAVEQHLQNCGMTYTILRPGCFMEAWLTPMVGFDPANAKAQIFGEGTQPMSYISLTDVAKFAVESLKNPAAGNAILELGGPDQPSQLDVVKIFEEVTGQKFELQYLPMDALQAQLDSTTDPMQKSFAGLMLCCAKGDPIDMKETLKAFPMKLTSVREYAERMVPVA